MRIVGCDWNRGWWVLVGLEMGGEGRGIADGICLRFF